MIMAETQTYIGILVVHECGNCGIVFGMTRDFYERKLNDHTGWCCPNGCNRIFTAKSEAEKLREELTRKEAAITYLHDRVEKLNYSVRAQKAAKTKIMNRVKNGVCPCCNRTFQNLQSHFIKSHPELVKQVSINPIHKKINSNGKEKTRQ